MTRETEILGMYLVIAGFKGAKIKDVDALFKQIHQRVKDSYVQIFDATLIAGWEHLYFAALNSIKAFRSGLNISKNLAVESLLYVSGQHQIKKAVEMFGVKPNSPNVAVLIIAREKEDTVSALELVSEILSDKLCDDVLELTDEKVEAIKDAFNISNLEIEAASRGEELKKALTNLVIEHVALLSVQR